ncbi:xylulokinase [Zunongwangia endophytica]|uniref:FGGY-family carbohydrate kinase n=1 Tax=Zunongwangia endophytica TaxID=1808945 RepID=A0ABV8H9H7_9FLAO|nr:FGGY family carbohydrate kinase [Zunongwangia endophytica]MDN3594910.1 FGGY family carbohydrate kinase [Zunongwangia endophytica]
MYFLGIDLGSSSVKLSIFDAESQKSIAAVGEPKSEMAMEAEKPGWAEQDPNQWWVNVKVALNRLKSEYNIELSKIKAIGIAYQMHGLVLTDKNLKPVRPSIIWCDSRAAAIGEKAFHEIGEEKCHDMILGSPANFTASKLKWVKENEPEIYQKAAYMMLPGDYIAACFSEKPQISKGGLSEGMLWHFKENRLATEILDHYEISEDLVPEIVSNFGDQATISSKVAKELGLSEDVKITYRAGDQPSNAMSLNVLSPGEIATTAGTSAVIYSVSENHAFDKDNRINTFLHVNNQEEENRNGVMVCINGSGILYQWLRNILSTGNDELLDYDYLNEMAAKSSPGSEGLIFHPFGNGVERIFQNKEVSSGISNLNFNIHKTPHLVRAACEGIVFAMNYGFEIMQEVGASGKTVRAGKDNLFLSEVFREIFVNTTNTTLQLYKTNGADGAARGAAFGYGHYETLEEAFDSLECLQTIAPKPELVEKYKTIYNNWKKAIKF